MKARGDFPTLEAALEEVHRIRAAANPGAAADELKRVLASRHSAAVASAAGAAAALELTGLEEALTAAFERLMKNPAKSDRGCLAKTAIADALYRLGARAERVFPAGARFVQLEAAYGPSADTAARLRGICALGLVRSNHSDCLGVAAELLADGESETRVLAARAVGYRGDPAGVPLLRHKLFAGDPDPAVLFECVAALLSLAPEEAGDILQRYLVQATVEALEAILPALSASRSSDVFRVLAGLWRDESSRDRRCRLLEAVVGLRIDESLRFLMEQLAEAPGPLAREVLESMEPLKFDVTIRDRVEEVCSARDDGALEATFARVFAD